MTRPHSRVNAVHGIHLQTNQHHCTQQAATYNTLWYMIIPHFWLFWKIYAYVVHPFALLAVMHHHYTIFVKHKGHDCKSWVLIFCLREVRATLISWSSTYKRSLQPRDNHLLIVVVWCCTWLLYCQKGKLRPWPTSLRERRTGLNNEH